jgi:hypothetical protein
MSAKKKSTKVATPAITNSPIEPKEKRALLTAGELRAYFTNAMAALEGLRLILDAVSTEKWSECKAPGFVCDASEERLSKLDQRLDARFEELHGDTPRFSTPPETPLFMTSEEIEEYETAMSPVLSFHSMIEHQDMTGEAPISEYAGWIMRLFRDNTDRFLKLMRDRLVLVEGGAK